MMEEGGGDERRKTKTDSVKLPVYPVPWLSPPLSDVLFLTEDSLLWQEGRARGALAEGMSAGDTLQGCDVS